MSLFEDQPSSTTTKNESESSQQRKQNKETDDSTLIFPSEPAFLVPVEVRDTPQYGVGHKGVFCTAPIQKGIKFWKWTNRIISIPNGELESYIDKTFGNSDNKLNDIQLFLRQGFVLPGKDKDHNFHSNPTDAGRFMNHSSNPNCGPDGALRDIEEGEELTMDYNFHGNPQWYQDICKKYEVLTEREIASRSRHSN